MTSSSIITLLKADHKHVASLLKDAIAARKATKRADLFAEIKNELVLHTRFEETAIYPVLEARKSSRGDALEAEAEHAQIKHLLSEIAATDPDDDRWKARVTVLAEDIRHHVGEEESAGGIFAELRKALSVEELKELGQRYAEEKGARLTELVQAN